MSGRDDEAEAAARVDALERGGPAVDADPELAAMARVRSLFRALPDQEPPAAATAKILAAAARARPAKREGLLARWFATLVASPGLAAAASLVVVAGVAGLLVARGHGEVVAPPSSAPAPVVAGQATPATPAAPTEPDEGRAEPRSPDVPGDERTDEAAATVGHQAAAKSKTRVSLSPPMKKAESRGGVGAGLDDVVGSPGAGSGAARGAEKGAGSVEGGGAGGGAGGGPARSTRTEDAQPTRAQDPASGAAASTPPAAAPRRPQAPTSDKPKESAPGAAQVPSGAPAPAAAPAQERTPAPAAAPADEAEAPASNAAPPAKAKDQGRARLAVDPEIVKLHHAAIDAAAKGDCAAARVAVARLRARDPAYYAAEVAHDGRLAGCLAAK